VTGRRTCAGITKAGAACRARAVLADGYCSAHSPTRAVDMAELGSRGGKRSVEARREQAKSLRQRIAEKLEADADEIYDAFRNAWREGDWHAAVAAFNQAFGSPPVAIVGDEERPVSFQVVSAFAAGVGTAGEIEGGN